MIYRKMFLNLELKICDPFIWLLNEIQTLIFNLTWTFKRLIKPLKVRHLKAFYADI